ncbi:mitochondrial rna polymerase [Moniliophthora roreri]|nr:mitochondrial rna polymerase [Moniliophthora roreri]
MAEETCGILLAACLDVCAGACAIHVHRTSAPAPAVLMAAKSNSYQTQMTVSILSRISQKLMPL